MAEPPYTGRCACGAVRWRGSGPPVFAGLCHCESCRRASGAPFVGWLALRDDRLTITGEIAEHRSSPHARWGRCAACGAPLYYRTTRYPGETHLYAGSLDDPARFTPHEHYHWEERVPWVTFSDDFPRHEGISE